MYGCTLEGEAHWIGSSEKWLYMSNSHTPPWLSHISWLQITINHCKHTMDLIGHRKARVCIQLFFDTAFQHLKVGGRTCRTVLQVQVHSLGEVGREPDWTELQQPYQFASAASVYLLIHTCSYFPLVWQAARASDTTDEVRQIQRITLLIVYESKYKASAI